MYQACMGNTKHVWGSTKHVWEYQACIGATFTCKYDRMRVSPACGGGGGGGGGCTMSLHVLVVGHHPFPVLSTGCAFGAQACEGKADRVPHAHPGGLRTSAVMVACHFLNRHTYTYGIFEGIGVCMGVPAKRGQTQNTTDTAKKRR